LTFLNPLSSDKKSDIFSVLVIAGLVKTLHGLNITNNPLEFPPADVLQRGTYEIQKFLRDMLQAKSSGQMNSVKDGKHLKGWRAGMFKK
jgi:hypothetical protein